MDVAGYADGCGRLGETSEGVRRYDLFFRSNVRERYQVVGGLEHEFYPLVN